MRGARLWALISVGIAWLTAIVASGVLGASWHPFRIAITTLGLAICFGIGEGIRARLEHGEARRAQLAERRTASEQEERSRIARELHDVLAHSLSQIAVQSGVGLHLFDREPERAREALANIRTLSATGLDEVRGVLSFLRGDEPTTTTAPLTPQPQFAQLPSLAAQRTGLGLAGGARRPARGRAAAERGAGDRVSHRPGGPDQRGAPLGGIPRHDRAGPGCRRARRHRRRRRKRHSRRRVERGGLRGMRERAELIDGTLTIAPGERGGTEVIARLPWRVLP